MMSTRFAVKCLGTALAVAIVFLASADIRAEDTTDRVVAANRALKTSLQRGSIKAEWIKGRLLAHDYAALEQKYQDAETTYLGDVLSESYWVKSFEAISPGSGISFKELDAWVAATESAIAYTARGSFKASQAADARGDDFIKNTPDSNLDAMVDYHIGASRDLITAIAKDSSMTPAYIRLIQVAMMSPAPFTPVEVFGEAIKHDSISYYLYSQLMVAFRPRWGGSYELMEALGTHAASLADLNPRLWTFQGAVAADQAQIYGWKKDDANTARLYSVALSYGERPTWLKARADCYYNLGEYQLAKDDYGRVLFYEPHNQKAGKWLAFAAMALHRQQEPPPTPGGSRSVQAGHPR